MVKQFLILCLFNLVFHSSFLHLISSNIFLLFLSKEMEIKEHGKFTVTKIASYLLLLLPFNCNRNVRTQNLKGPSGTICESFLTL